MLDISQFAKIYYSALKDIVLALPAGASIPPFLKDTSFVFAFSDRAGKVAIDITSRDNLKELIWKGKTLSPVSVDEPGFVIAQDVPALEQLLFPQDDRRTSVSITIADRHVVLDGLAFSSKEYNDKYWKDATFYRNCAGTIPFTVTSSGSMLGLDLLWGAELDGQRQERLFEYIKIYGGKKCYQLRRRKYKTKRSAISGVLS